jgi:LacI family transcriptional regulator
MKPPGRHRRLFEPPEQKRVLMMLAYYEHRMHLGVIRYARQAQWIVDSTMAHYGTLPDQWQGDGILTVVLPDRRDLIRYLQAATVPIVALTADVEGIATARVLLDNARMGRIAAEHLLERGFRHLAFFKCTDYADVRERQAGFAAAVQEAGLNYECLDWYAASRKETRLDLPTWLSRRLRDLPKPLGVMAQSDHRAYYLVNICQSVGLAIPSQVAVVGVDNDECTCDFAPVPITSVDSNRHELAYRGAELLDRLVQGQPPPAQPILVPPAGLIVRRSSDILAVEHPEVSKALSFIWQHYHRPIGVDDVVAATAMSRCSLYRAFEKYVGRTIREELERKRIERGQQLLLTTASKVSHIARLTGFGSGEQFCRAFARITGLTPSDFRKRR